MSRPCQCIEVLYAEMTSIHGGWRHKCGGVLIWGQYIPPPQYKLEEIVRENSEGPDNIELLDLVIPYPLKHVWHFLTRRRWLTWTSCSVCHKTIWPIITLAYPRSGPRRLTLCVSCYVTRADVEGVSHA